MSRIRVSDKRDEEERSEIIEGLTSLVEALEKEPMDAGHVPLFEVEVHPFFDEEEEFSTVRKPPPPPPDDEDDAL